MALLHPIGTTLLVYDKLLRRLRDYSNAAGAVNPDTTFWVEENFLRAADPEKLPMVVVYHPDMDPEMGKSSATRGYAHYVATFRMDLVTANQASLEALEDQAPDSFWPVSRLIYLKQQVLNAIYDHKDSRMPLDLPIGTIGNMSYPRFRALMPNMQNQENLVIGYECDFEVHLPYEAPSEALELLEEIHVRSGQIQANNDNLQGA